MMKILFATLCLLSGCFTGCLAQAPGFFPTIDNRDFPDANFGVPKTYTGASLFGYIDGGAELYLEYGFSGAWVNELQIGPGKYTLEIYRMSGPEEAFGIFSVSRFQCKSTPPLTPFTCQTKYQLQICSGPFYINIINSSGNSMDSLTSLKIGAVMVSKIKEASAHPSDYLPGMPEGTVNSNAILVKGSLGLMNGAPDLADYFGEATRYTAVILKSAEETIVSAKFATPEVLNAFAKGHGWNLEALANGKACIFGTEKVTRVSPTQVLIRK
jgi:hypothetical protein